MIKRFEDKVPVVSEKAYIQEGVKIVGDVIIEDNVSIWYNSTIRADIDLIHIKEGSNIQELTSIHNDVGFPVIIGKNVTVGHGCIIHGAKIGDNCLIGMGTTILNGTKIANNCLVGAGSLVTQNSVFEEENMLILGSPARAIRPLKESEIAYIRENAEEYQETIKRYIENDKKINEDMINE